MTIDFEQDAAENKVATQTEVQRAIALAEEMVARKKLVAEAEAELKTAKTRLEEIENKELPDLLIELGLTEIKLADGSKIEVKEQIKASITAENADAAFKWLRENDFAGIIKTGVSFEFDRGDDEAANKFAGEVFEQFGQTPAVKNTVHSMTLKSFVKEQIEAGTDIPRETFGVYVFNQAVYKKA